MLAHESSEEAGEVVTPLSMRGGLCCAVLSPQTALCGAGGFWRCLWALGERSLARFAFPWRRRRGLSRDSSRFGQRRWLVGLLLDGRLLPPFGLHDWELLWGLPNRWLHWKRSTGSEHGLIRWLGLLGVFWFVFTSRGRPLPLFEGNAVGVTGTGSPGGTKAIGISKCIYFNFSRSKARKIMDDREDPQYSLGSR